MFGSVGVAYAQTSIRQIDFKNHVYPLSGPAIGHDHLQWLDQSKKGSFRLAAGWGDSRGLTFTLDSVTYADVTGDGKEDALVVLGVNGGGTQASTYIYIYSFQQGHAELMAYCYTGDRGYLGLYRVYGKDRLLVIELNDPSKRQGDCCSTQFIRTKYVWRGGKFVSVGRREFGPIRLEEGPG
jgi:hypothetical protein